jgi:hypothetical protein
MAALVYDQIPGSSVRVYRRDSDGAIMVEADDLAEGIMDYDGVRELITPEAVEAYRPHIAHLTVTLGHPADEVTPDTVERYGVGNVDGDPQIVTQPGGWTAVRSKHILRRRDAVDAAERHLSGGEPLTGMSLGHIPIRDSVSGVHPIFGRYDRRRIGCVAVNHTALCGASDALPPPRGKNCGIYLDSTPRKEQPMTRKEARKAIRDALASVTDATSIDKAIPILKELAADPIGLMVIKAIAEGNEPAEEAPVIEAIPAEAMDAMIDQRIEALIAPLRAELDALKTARATADAADKATRDAAELVECRALAKRHGLVTADAADRAACVAHLRAKLGGTTDAEVLAVARYAASLPAPVLPIADSAHTTVQFEV